MIIPSRFGNIIKHAQEYDFLINDHRVENPRLLICQPEMDVRFVTEQSTTARHMQCPCVYA